MIENILDGIEVRLGEDYLKDKAKWNGMACKIVYTGPIDAYFDYCFIVLLDLRQSYWISQISRVMLLLIIRIERRLGPASLSTNGLSLAQMKKGTIHLKR